MSPEAEKRALEKTCWRDIHVCLMKPPLQPGRMQEPSKDAATPGGGRWRMKLETQEGWEAEPGRSKRDIGSLKMDDVVNGDYCRRRKETE